MRQDAHPAREAPQPQTFFEPAGPDEVFWLTDWIERRVLFVSASFESVWGRSAESLRADSTSWAEAIHPEDRERVVRAFDEKAERGEYRQQYRILRPSGEVRWILDRAFPIRDAEGRVVQIAGLAEDVTERWFSTQLLGAGAGQRERDLGRAIEANREGEGDLPEDSALLLESERRYRQLTETIEEVFWLTDRTSVLYVSPAYEKVWGCSPEPLFKDKRAWMDPIHPDDKARVQACFESLFEVDGFDTEYRVCHPDGTLRWVHDRGFVIRNEAGEVVRVAGMALDITRRKVAEEELEGYQLRLREMASELVFLEEKERRRLAVELHDGLNQTIALARMKLGELRRTGPAGEPNAEAAWLSVVGEIEDLIDGAWNSARSLTAQLSPPILHDLGLVPALQWLADDFHQAHGLRVAFRHLGDPVPEDERLSIFLFRAGRELLMNVVKHAGVSEARLLLRHLEGEVRLVVEDAGRGFRIAEHEANSFGLFSIRERLDPLGGNLSVDSSPGRGTRVVVSAPVSAPVGPPVGPPASLAEEAPSVVHGSRG